MIRRLGKTMSTYILLGLTFIGAMAVAGGISEAITGESKTESKSES